MYIASKPSSGNPHLISYQKGIFLAIWCATSFFSYLLYIICHRENVTIRLECKLRTEIFVCVLKHYNLCVGPSRILPPAPGVHAHWNRMHLEPSKNILRCQQESAFTACSSKRSLVL